MEKIPDILCAHIGKVYKDGSRRTEALSDISLSVNHGEMFCIVGPSGCGKTTLVKILAGLLNPTTGTVQLNPERRQAGIAYVQQFSQLLPWRTVIQNVALGIELKRTVSRAHLERLHDDLRKFGLAEFSQKKYTELSGGMRQRTALLCALASAPQILFCDEPFTAIDFVGRLELNTQFKAMCKVNQITTVFVTHNIEEAIFLGDTIIVLSSRPGRVIGSHRVQLSKGAHDAVLCRESPEFHQLFMKIWQQLQGNYAN